METTDEWNKVRGFIAEKVKKSGSHTHWYIGLRKESGAWKWTESGLTVATNDNRWQRHQPSTNNPEEKCAEINSEHPAKMYGHFNNVRCNVKYAQKTDVYNKPLPPRGYICENF